MQKNLHAKTTLKCHKQNFIRQWIAKWTGPGKALLDKFLIQIVQQFDLMSIIRVHFSIRIKALSVHQQQ